MSYGLRVWNASGNLVFDADYNFLKYVAVVEGGFWGQPVGTTFFHPIPGVSNDGTWTYIRGFIDGAGTFGSSGLISISFEPGGVRITNLYQFNYETYRFLIVKK